MPKNILTFDLQRPSTAVPWGITVCGGRDQGLTFKIGNVKRMSPASKAGLSKMDYLISVTYDGFIILLHTKIVLILT